jgi:hypothetical protein
VMTSVVLGISLSIGFALVAQDKKQVEG